MKLSLNWIKEYVDVSDKKDEEIIQGLMLSTAEIEQVEKKGNDLKSIVVGEIIEIENVENNISLVNVKYGKDKQEKVICGATNLYKGMKVAFAPVGSVVQGMDIKRVELYGHYSNGMCCSEKELGIGEDHDGIIDLGDSAQVGKDIKTLYQIEDTVFEVDNKSLTHRPDLWSHYGFAREVAAIFDRKLKPIEKTEVQKSDEQFNIKISDKNCKRYSGIKVSNIDNTLDSPINMKIRLFYTGMRSLNLLADISNYVMLEMGQPMHVFDNDLVEDIEVKKPNNKMNFKTLDNETKIVNQEDLMIYELNKDEPVAIAGVMGGLDTEVESKTSKILLESATFDAASIRKTSTKLALRSEASQRYEKSLDPQLTIDAIKRYIHLLKKSNPEAKIATGIVDEYKDKYPQIKIKTTVGYIKKYSGIENLTKATVVKILKNLGFEVLDNETNLEVLVPSFRATRDINIEQDLLEEITRIYGYDNIKPKPLKGKLNPVEQNLEYKLESNTKRILAESFGLNEVHTYVWRNSEYNKSRNIKTPQGPEVINSTVKENNQIRTHLMPSLIKVAEKNYKNYKGFKIFEIARVSNIDNNSNIKEKKKLSIVNVHSGADYESIYFELKTIIKNLVELLKNEQISFKFDSEIDYLHPKNQVSLYLSGQKIGHMGVINPKVVQKISKEISMTGLEIDFKALVNIDKKQKDIKPVSKFPSTYLDFNFLIPKELLYSDIVDTINKFNCDLNFDFKLKDIFDDDNYPDKLSYTFNFEIYSYNHTLKNEEIEDFSNKLIEYMQNKKMPLKR